MRSLSLRPFQSKAIELLRSADRLHLICIAPTGSGKSRIFEELARLPNNDGPAPGTLVISPLRALVQQQRDRLTSLGIQIVSEFTEQYGAPQAIVCTPEWLMARIDRGFRIPENIFLVVDECHCIEAWGRNFRPEFALLPGLVRKFGIRRSLWLSATLSGATARSLAGQLPDPVRQMGEFGINPRLRVTRVRTPWNSRPAFLRGWLDQTRTPGIVFCSTRQQCIQVGRLLESWSSSTGSTACYHAGMSREERNSVESGIRSDVVRWISATSAFGMGMDFSQLGWVVLWQLPYSVLDLAQMIGRAGRSDSIDARAFILWDDSDFLWLRNHLDDRSLASFRQIIDEAAPLSTALARYFEA